MMTFIVDTSQMLTPSTITTYYLETYVYSTKQNDYDTSCRNK